VLRNVGRTFFSFLRLRRLKEECNVAEIAAVLRLCLVADLKKRSDRKHGHNWVSKMSSCHAANQHPETLKPQAFDTFKKKGLD